jgi:toxin ParE1/3/4
MSGFVLHPEAVTDLNEIQDYIGVENRRAADQVLQEIYETIQTLVSFPQLGHSRPELTSRTLRFHPVRNYLIVYAPSETPLLVVAVLHGSRSPRVIAAFLRGRK